MSEQTVSKSVQFIPNVVVEFFKEIYHQEISKVESLRNYRTSEGLWKVFKVNKQFIVYMLNGKLLDVTTADAERGLKKAFGKRVKYVMQEADVPWELAKVAVKMNPVNTYNPEHRANADALNFIEDVKETLENYRIFNGGRMMLEEYLKKYGYKLGCLTQRQIRIIEEYWLSQQIIFYNNIMKISFSSKSPG